MTPRFRMIAGPNGSGKTTLFKLLTEQYAVNFYTFLNADTHLDRAYFFDASGLVISYLAEYEASDGFTMRTPIEALPGWFSKYVHKDFGPTPCQS